MIENETFIKVKLAVVFCGDEFCIFFLFDNAGRFFFGLSLGNVAKFDVDSEA
jgi:hypothetical protein